MIQFRHSRLLLWVGFFVVLTLVSSPVVNAHPLESTTQPAAVVCPPNWQQVGSPNPSSSNRLESVEAIADNDVWAVGYQFDFAATPDRTLAMHWDGAAWTTIPTIDPVAGSYLTDVKAFATDDVWAVGLQYTGYAETLIEHWDGTEWSVIPSPNQGPSTNELHAIDGVAPDDIWAAGTTPGTHNTVTMHWDGEEWTIVSSLPNDFLNFYEITGLVAIAPNNVWGVGYYYADGTTDKNFTIHWNGTQWQRVAVPNPGSYVSRLHDVVAVSASEVYAVGQYSNDGGASYHPLLMRWNGTVWSNVSIPTPSATGYSGLESITIGTDGDLWAAGYAYEENLPSYSSTSLIMRRTGTEWSIVSSPNGGYSNTQLYGIDASPGGDLWSVGRSYNAYDTPWETFILRNDCIGGTPTPTASTTASATPTQTTPTATPTGTPEMTLTPTPNATLTPTGTATTTPSATATSTAVATNTPTATMAPSGTASPTMTVTAAPSVTATGGTATVTPQATRTASPTPPDNTWSLYLPIVQR